ncbi:MAG: sensor domain-containing diguanylate cyclase [Lachnospiraceae bacterium]|nr:sensor domain-containing diguanylate cyclase [Lachnospiraceae bacterium]
MRRELKNLRKNRYIMLAHQGLYGAVGLFTIIGYFVPETVSLPNSLLNTAEAGSRYVEKETITLPYLLVILAALVLMVLMESASYKGKKHFLEGDRIGPVYHVCRLTFATVFSFILQDSQNGLLFFALILFFAIETVFYVPFDELIKRVGFYAVFTLIYVILSMTITMAMGFLYQDNKISIPLLFRELMLDIVMVLAVVAIGEVLANIWNYFEGHLMMQNRAMEDLNEANEVLKEHQEKIKKTNEMLGMQKIELQTANKKINRAHDEMSVQNEISSIIATSLEKEELLQNITRIMQIRLDMDWVMVILEPDNSLLVPGEEPKGRFVAMSSSLGQEFEEEIMDSINKTELKKLLSLSQTYIQNSVTDTIKFFKYLEEEKEPASMLCLPIIKQDERLGTLVVGKNRENAFMDSRVFYENIASQLSIGISNAALYAKMNDMAIRDGLTRIYNRRYLTEQLDTYLAEAIKQKVPVSLALFDIDKFKMVNDTYGHQCGDEVIRYVATLLNRCALSHGGIAGRYGGEEFVVAFLGKDLDETYRIIEEVHGQIRSDTVSFGGREIQVRASAGVASYPHTCSNPSELLTRADWAMYHSKRNGRDQITIDSDQITNTM